MTVKPTADHYHIYPLVRKIVVFCVGGSVLAIGFVMIALPAPSIIVIPIGLTILATEFIWARQLLKRLKHKIEELREKFPSFH